MISKIFLHFLPFRNLNAKWTLHFSSVDMSKDQLPREPPTPPTRTSEALKANLQSVNKHLEELKKQWEAEKKKLLGEKAVLEDAANRLNSQVKNTKDEARKNAEQTRAGEKLRANVENVRL